MTHLKATVAILALTAGTAFAGTSVSTEAEVKAETSLETAADETKEFANDAAQATENAAEATVDAASDAAAAVEDTAKDAASATAETVNDAAEYTEDALQADASVDAEMSTMVVGDLIGKDVAEANGEVVGEIDYIVRDGDDLAAVIGIGGFLGLGEYTVAIPLNEFDMSAEEDMLMLSNWTETELEAQPEFDETNVEGLPEDMPIDQLS
ncbi:PRC-barrel domain-containing protein [uncultured Roseobacter sp.]|uniref:PRC-barrel domain-containing protein n=1 Tax=uncultured Roseobacter sp. TaxID=114847 RepID=UPI00262440EF|nr:PRC-barrel domain-containing protein [uncultured Roseobacter sp.]